jgi:uncharacterized protein (DUF58 family)
MQLVVREFDRDRAIIIVLDSVITAREAEQGCP